MTAIEKIAILKAYLLMKVEEGDWHAVRDCCVDIEMIIVEQDCKKINL